MPYATAAQVKAFSTLPEVDAKTDSEIDTRLIPRAERLIDAYAHQNFRLSEEKIIFADGSGARRLVLPERLALLIKIRFLDLDDGGAVILGAEEVKDIFNYGWFLNAGLEVPAVPRLNNQEGFERSLIFPLGSKNIEVTGKFGYATVPDEVRDATCLVVERFVATEKDTKAILGPFKSERIGSYSYELREGSSASLMIPPEAVMLLDAFKRPFLVARI